MTVVNWEKFQTALQNASKDKQELVNSDAIPNCARGVLISKQLDDSHLKSLVQLYSLFVLDASFEGEILEEMRRLGIPDSKEVLDALQVCREKNPAAEGGDLSSDIAEAEATLQAIPPPVRTMSQDMAQAQAGGEVTYSTTQAAILKESVVPKPPQEIPKWDSAAK